MKLNFFQRWLLPWQILILPLTTCILDEALLFFGCHDSVRDRISANLNDIWIIGWWVTGIVFIYLFGKISVMEEKGNK